MGPIANFFLALVVATSSLAGGSIAWPKFTDRTRPKLLQEVHDMAIKTPPGSRFAQVLGVSDEGSVEPINFGQAAASFVGGIRQTINRRIQTVIVKNAVNQLKRQYDKLPTDQQGEIQAALCVVPEASPSASQ